MMVASYGNYLIPFPNMQEAEKVIARAEDSSCAVELLDQSETEVYLKKYPWYLKNKNIVMIRIHGLAKKDRIKVLYGSWLSYIKETIINKIRRAI